MINQKASLQFNHLPIATPKSQINPKSYLKRKYQLLLSKRTEYLQLQQGIPKIYADHSGTVFKTIEAQMNTSNQIKMDRYQRILAECKTRISNQLNFDSQESKIKSSTINVLNQQIHFDEQVLKDPQVKILFPNFQSKKSYALQQLDQLDIRTLSNIRGKRLKYLDQKSRGNLDLQSSQENNPHHKDITTFEEILTVQTKVLSDYQACNSIAKSLKVLKVLENAPEPRQIIKPEAFLKKGQKKSLVSVSLHNKRYQFSTIKRVQNRAQAMNPKGHKFSSSLNQNDLNGLSRLSLKLDDMSQLQLDPKAWQNQNYDNIVEESNLDDFLNFSITSKQ